MADQTWTATTSGGVVDTLGNPVGSGDGAGTITITAATVQVTNGNTLRITAGVTVKMDSATGRFLVTRNASGSGTLLIEGTAVAPVRITSNQGSPAAGDYTGIELLNTNAASNPTVTADWLILEYATTGVFSVSGSQQCTVSLTDCTFRRIQQSHVQSALIPDGIWNMTRCIFDKCFADQPGASSNNLIIASGGGTGPTFNVDHCSILCNVLVSVGDQEVFQAGPRGTINVRNSIFVGTNSHGTRILTNAVVLAPGGVLTNDWNWYQTDGVGSWVNGANDQSKDPEYLDDSCAATFSDLRPNFDTGVSTADEFGALLGALEPYGVPVPPTPPTPEECGATYVGYIDRNCVPFVCDYDFFTGDYPEDWRRELYDRKEVQPHQLVVCIQVPTRGIALDFEFAPGVPIPVIGSTPDAVTVDLGCWVQSMRPIRAERDVTFREYQGSDLDLVFTDWFGRLDPKLLPSLFANIRWKGLRVDVGSWIHGTNSVLRHGRYFLQDIRRRSETTVLTLRDWFLETLDQPLRANFRTNVAIKSNNQAADFDEEWVDIDEDLATIESVRLVMLDEGREDSRTFQYVGSVTGDQGTGSFDADFTTADGAVTIRTEAWAATGFSTGIYAPKDEVRFNVSNLSSGTPVNVIYGYLTRFGPLVEGVDILASEFFQAEQLLPTMAPIQLRHDRPITLLEACRIAAGHGFLTLSTNAEGRVVLGGFKPTLALSLTEIQNVAICSSNDLKELETENLPVYNVIRSSYNPVDSDEIAHTGLVGGVATRWLTYPTEDLGPDFNRSLTFWGVAYPFDVPLPGFRKGQEAAVFAVLQMYWVFFEGTPTAREKLIATTKLHNLNRDLEDIVRLESEHPERAIWAQVIGYGKEPVKRKEVELTLVDISDIVQPDFSCGYAFCDSGHYCDDCWVCW